MKIRTTVLINCFNYEAYVVEAIESVTSQSIVPDELIVVDDGSTDGSVARIEQALEGVEYARLVSQPNRGQLAAFQHGVLEAKGEWIFFLDADDIYQRDHLETVLAAIDENPRNDFFFTDVAEYGDGQGNAFHYRGPEGDLGYSSLVTLYGFRIENVFIGGVSSTLCIRRTLLLRFFPFSDGMLSDWKVRADNVLVIGSSVVGGRKFSLPSPTVGYRIHGSNHFAGVERSKSDNTQDLLVTERLFGDLQQKAPYPREARRGLAVEYRGLANRDRFIRRRYYRVILGSGMSFPSLVRNLLVMLKANLRP